MKRELSRNGIALNLQNSFCARSHLWPRILGNDGNSAIVNASLCNEVFTKNQRTLHYLISCVALRLENLERERRSYSELKNFFFIIYSVNYLCACMCMLIGVID